jgi:Rrf2 family cysteine metabolism transcriptional repressor
MTGGNRATSHEGPRLHFRCAGRLGGPLITITEKSRSAVLALTELAQRGSAGPVPILEVAEARGIPLHFLEQLFAGLRRAGVLQSQRGVKGGYSFRRAPAEVTILDVVETVDGRLAPPGGAGAGEGTESVWSEARAGLAELLSGLTIADMVEREARLQSAPMFHI